MWIEVKKASNLMIAEMWKEFFEGEGIPARILQDKKKAGEGEFASYSVLIPREKDHVVAEIMRKM